MWQPHPLRQETADQQPFYRGRAANPAQRVRSIRTLAGVAEEFGAAHLDLRGPPGWGAGFLFGDIPVRGPPLELGRSERPTLRPLWSYGVIDDSTPVQQLR